MLLLALDKGSYYSRSTMLLSRFIWSNCRRRSILFSINTKICRTGRQGYSRLGCLSLLVECCTADRVLPTLPSKEISQISFFRNVFHHSARPSNATCSWTRCFIALYCSTALEIFSYPWSSSRQFLPGERSHTCKTIQRGSIWIHSRP